MTDEEILTMFHQRDETNSLLIAKLFEEIREIKAKLKEATK